MTDPLPDHTLSATGTSVTQNVGERWHTHCRCGWRSPVVADRRTAEQAHAAHALVDASALDRCQCPSCADPFTYGGVDEVW